MKYKLKLSRREKMVFALLKEGHKNREIASALDLNQKTVSTYVKRLRSKAGVPDKFNTYKAIVEIEKCLVAEGNEIIIVRAEEKEKEKKKLETA